MTKSPNSSETDENIQKLIKLKQSFYKEIYSHEEEIKRLKKKIDEIEDKIMGMCAHEWEYEHYYGMYDKPDKVCKFCDSRIYRF